ncbi:MAG: sigma-54-dependent Fis family transcriptional regulator [Bryobacterales bacterium]|nr:sigma-54-dependent Fis family transcriptional regulator [Bryobacterales bacterium]
MAATNNGFLLREDPSRVHKVLIVDDEPDAVQLVIAALSGIAGIELLRADSADGALQHVQGSRPGLVLLDLMMPGVSGFDLLDRLLSASPGSDIVLITGHYSMESAVEAVKKGAYNYLPKPLPVEKLRSLVTNWLVQTRARERAAELESRLSEVFQFEGIIGRSPIIMDLFARIERIAPHFTNALVTGETGTGKELVARVLHRLSPSREGPFVVCNCAAIAESLFESEIFGHAKGAFTGATGEHKGLIEHASGGTLFLDEIGEVPLSAQAKLLRFLQNREVQRLGDPAVRRVQVRMVAATNRDLVRMVGERTFREDLYYRLSMVQMRTPRLAERPEDLPLLIQHFLKRFGQMYGKPGLRLSRRAMSVTRRHHWPGNVRELENALNYSCMMAEREILEPEDFPEAIRVEMESSLGQGPHGDLITLEEYEQRYLDYVLEQVQGNRARAAQVLGIGRATLYRMLNRKSAAATSS